MEAGKLKKRITLQRQNKQRDASGQVVGIWEDFAHIWAEMKCTDSTTVDSRGAVQHEGLYKFFIRWRGDITADMRVCYQGRTFELTGPPADWSGERVGLTLLTRELVKNGTNANRR